MDLSARELRVLGCLIEKAHTTPDQYPLTTNSLVVACNQKTSRDPVVSYTGSEVDQTVRLLREAGLVRTVRAAGMRSHKHKHVVDEAMDLTDGQQAVLAVLILRGPQSAGELRTRTDRYVSFADVEAVEEVLEGLRARPDALTSNIGRLAGQSQDRWVHCMLEGESGQQHAGPVGAAHGVEQVVSGSALDLASSNEPADRVRSSIPSADSSEPSDQSSLVARVAALEKRLDALEADLGG